MGRKVPEVILVALLCGCPADPSPPAPRPPPTIVLGSASRKALAELPAPVAVTADLSELADDDAARIAALLDAFAAGGRLTWHRGPPSGVTLRTGARVEHLAVPAREGPIEIAEIEAGLVTRLLRLAHGRKKIGITVGHGEDGWDGLTDPELGLAADYEIVRVDWAAPKLHGLDGLVVDGPRGALPRPALAALRAFGRPVLYLVDEAVDPELLAPVGIHVVPGALVDPVNGTPFWTGGSRDGSRDGGAGGIALSAAPLAQVLAGAPGDPLAHLHYVSVPLAVALLAPSSARPLLRTSPQTEGGARIVGYATESAAGTRLVVVGSAALVGAARLSLHRRLGTEVTAGGFRAVSRLVGWLVSDVEVVDVVDLVDVFDLR